MKPCFPKEELTLDIDPVENTEEEDADIPDFFSLRSTLPTRRGIMPSQPDLFRDDCIRALKRHKTRSEEAIDLDLATGSPPKKD